MGRGLALYMRSWIVPLRGRQLARVGPNGGFEYQRSVAEAWSRIARAHTLVRARGLDLLPADAGFPEMHSHLTDGRFSPATAPLGAAAAPGIDDDDNSSSPAYICSPDSFDSACHHTLSKSSSAVVASLEFLSLYDASTAAGRARLLDGSVARGPFSHWRRVPTLAPAELTWVGEASEPIFAFSDPDDFSRALALDLLAMPPVAGEDGGVTVCGRSLGGVYVVVSPLLMKSGVRVVCGGHARAPFHVFGWLYVSRSVV